MKIEYTGKNFNRATLELIAYANKIIEKYQGEGYDLTLRQLYYQFVSRDIIRNKQTEYKRLGAIINDARMAGMIDWSAIVDRTRNVWGNSHWNSPAGILQSCMHSYAIDKRDTQEEYIEVWIEKEALAGVIEGVCSDNDVPHFSCKGYTSQSEMWGAAQRIIRQGKDTTIIHLGDHDPSGIDMTRDIQDRLNIFCEGYQIVKVQRIALNFKQIEEFKPPPNPAKSTDSRFETYYHKYGPDSWELDALNPQTITKIIKAEIDKLTDFSLIKAALKTEDEHKSQLSEIIDNLREGE